MRKGTGNFSLTMVQKFFPHVTEVTDADDDIELEVEEGDSKSGSLKDHNHCAFARACQRKFKARGVIVSISTAYVILKEGAIRYQLPESVSREIVSFDRKGGFAEGTYVLKAPEKHHRLGARQERSGGGTHEHKGGKKRLFRHVTANVRAMLRSGEKAKVKH